MSRRRWLLVGAAALLLLVGFLTNRWFVNPTTDEPGTADAIFVLGGGGNRVQFAVDLARDGVADQVVFASSFVEEERVWAARPCNTRRPRGVPDSVTFECFEPDPGTTRGEARLLRDLAEEHGWESVVVVVSTDQVTRARRLIERCWDGEIRIVDVDHHDPWWRRAVYEWGAGLKATFLRSC
ncbi:MAG: ElyC/SanA/YdcF family protein [Acidimicrobiales bacterium]|nr:ElyC/SanA/YdcF family protein [Acidimicrobiales bacterium]